MLNGQWALTHSSISVLKQLDPYDELATHINLPLTPVKQSVLNMKALVGALWNFNLRGGSFPAVACIEPARHRRGRRVAAARARLFAWHHTASSPAGDQSPNWGLNTLETAKFWWRQHMETGDQLLQSIFVWSHILMEKSVFGMMN